MPEEQSSSLLGFALAQINRRQKIKWYNKKNYEHKRNTLKGKKDRNQNPRTKQQYLCWTIPLGIQGKRYGFLGSQGVSVWR